VDSSAHDLTPSFPNHALTLEARRYRPLTTARWNNSVQRALAHMRSHIAEGSRSTEMANVGAMSPFHFSRVFRRTTGIPPIHFLSAIRLELAKRLLLTTKRNVTDVCFEVGYSSLGTFVSRFTELVGMSPNSFRRTVEDMEGIDLRPLCEQFNRRGERHLLDRRTVAVRVRLQEKFLGVIFIAVYPTLLPHGRPLHCGYLTEPGVFKFNPSGAGTYTVVAAGLEPIVKSISFLDEGIAVRGALRDVTIVNGLGVGSLELLLGPPTPFDPPILAPIPAMLMLRMQPSRSVGISGPNERGERWLPAAREYA
jgi:AraC family transcriptional regulator